jgi:hypothetical protein
MAEKVEIDIEVQSNLGESIADLKELKKQLKQTAAGSDEFKKLFNQIDDLEDKIKGAKKSSADWVDTLESAGGPLGALGSAINKAKVATTSFGAAFNAIGIGALVSLIAGLVGAFSQTEGAMKKFEPLLIAMEQIFGGILEALQPLIDGFIELAINVMPTVTNVFKKVYSAVTAVFQSLGKLGSAVVKLFKGDFKGAWEDAKSSVTSFSDNYEAAKDRFEIGASKMTKTQKKNLKEQKDDRDKYLQELIKQLDAEQKLKEGQLNKEKAIAMQSAFGEEQKLAVEQQFAQKSYDLQVAALNKKQALYKKDSAEWKTLQAEKETAEGEFINTTTANTEKQKELAAARNQAIIDFEVELAKRLQELADEKSAKDLALADRDRAGKANLIESEYQLKRAKGEATFQDDLAVFENARALDRKTLVAHKATNDELEAFDNQTAAGRIQIEQATQDAKLGVISNALGSVASLVGENTVAGKALAVAQAGIDTYAGANKALAAYPPPFGAIAAGTVIAAGLMNVRKILSTQLPKIPGSKSSSSQGPAPSLPSIPSIPTPQIQTGQGINATAQIAQTIGASQKPIQAYVVSTQMSSQQALDRRTNAAATFS